MLLRIQVRCTCVSQQVRTYGVTTPYAAKFQWLRLQTKSTLPTALTKYIQTPGGALIKNLPANPGGAEDTGSIPGSGRSPGGGNVNPLQYSCLKNSSDRGAWGLLQSGGSQRVGHDSVSTAHGKIADFIQPIPDPPL